MKRSLLLLIGLLLLPSVVQADSPGWGYVAPTLPAPPSGGLGLSAVPSLPAPPSGGLGLSAVPTLPRLAVPADDDQLGLALVAPDLPLAAPGLGPWPRLPLDDDVELKGDTAPARSASTYEGLSDLHRYAIRAAETPTWSQDQRRREMRQDYNDPITSSPGYSGTNNAQGRFRGY